MLCLHTRGTQIQDVCKAPCQREVWWTKNEKAHVLRAVPSYKKLCKPLCTNLFSRKSKQLVCQSTKAKYHDKTHKSFAWISSQGRNPGANQPKQDTNSQKLCTNLWRKNGNSSLNKTTVKKFTKALLKSCKERKKLWCRSSKAMINSQLSKKQWTLDGMGGHFFYLSNN